MMIRNPVPWPNGARVACAITLDMDADSLVHIAHPKDSITRLSAMSMLRYGPDVAIPRVLETYRRFGLKQTFFIPAWCIEHHPKAVEAIVKDGHEIGFHGYVHEAQNQLPLEEERYWMKRSIAVIEKATGKRPRGSRSPLYNCSMHTFDLLAEEGFVYDASLMGDDIPYILRTPKGDIVELPSHWACDDWPPYVQSMDLNYMMQIMSPDRAMEVFMAEFEAQWECRGLWIGVWHPFVSGRLARWLRVEKMIEAMQKKGGVWFAPLEEIAAHVLKVTATGTYTARIDKLPYFATSPMPTPWPTAVG
jgi:peptidoglycan-N-acetylglucosamine deacetylase